jgi:hypothetical protein
MIKLTQKDKELFVKLINNNEMRKDANIKQFKNKKTRVIYWFAKMLCENQPLKILWDNETIAKKLDIKRTYFQDILKCLEPLFFRTGDAKTKGSGGKRKWMLTYAVTSGEILIKKEEVKVKDIIEEKEDDGIFDDEENEPSTITKAPIVNKLFKYNEGWETMLMEYIEENLLGGKTLCMNPSLYYRQALDYAGVELEVEASIYTDMNQKLFNHIRQDNYTVDFIYKSCTDYINSIKTVRGVNPSKIKYGCYVHWVLDTYPTVSGNGYQQSEEEKQYADSLNQAMEQEYARYS